MEESRVNRAANKILFVTKREELLIAEDEQDKVIDTLFEEERQLFTDKIRSSLEEENRYLEETTKNITDTLKSLLDLKFQSFPDETDWVPKWENASGISIKDVNVKELKSKGIEVIYTKNGVTLKEPKIKEKPKRKAEDKEDAEPEAVGNDAVISKNPADTPSAPEEKSSANGDVNGGSDSGKVMRKRRRI